MPVIGALRWAIAEGYIPGWSNGPAPQMESHETVCILNAGDRDAQVEIVIYFAAREPAGTYRFVVPARRTRHLRFNGFRGPGPGPRGAGGAGGGAAGGPGGGRH